jgi:hypothetical protein
MAKNESMLWRPIAGGQADFASDITHRYVFLEGGWSSGKTWIGARKLLCLHLLNAFDKKGNPTGCPSAIIAPTYQAAKDYCIPALQEAMDQAHWNYEFREAGSLDRGRFGAPGIIVQTLSRPRKPSVILVRTADVPEHITGWEVGAAWGDEPSRWPESVDPKYDPFTQLLGRVRHPSARLHQLLFTYTNEGTRTRIYREAHNPSSAVAVYRARTADNKVVAEFAGAMLKKLTPELADQYLNGSAIDVAGRRVYPYFDAEKHVDTAVCFDPHRPLAMMWDFNSNPGMHMLLGQWNQDADVFSIFHEFFEPRLDLRRILTDLFPRWLQDNAVTEVHCFGDASGRNRLTGHNESNWDYVKQGLDLLGVNYRIRVPAANPFIEERVNAFNAAMLDLSGNVHCKLHPRCQRLICDLETMTRGQDGALDKSDASLSHASDAVGYAVWYLRPIRKPQLSVGQINV